MRKKIKASLCLAATVFMLLPGCAFSQAAKRNVEWDFSDLFFDFFRESEFDKLFEQGYGYNNPRSKRAWEK